MGREGEDAGRPPERKKGIKLVARGHGGIKTAPTSEHVAGTGSTLQPRARRGLVPGYHDATAGARHNLKTLICRKAEEEDLSE